jgi:hypothetical protein
LSLVEVYNRALEDKEQEAAFWKTYPGEFLGIVNDSERTRRPGIRARFGPAGNGDFYAFQTGLGGNRYQVVPRFGRAPTRERLGGAWGEVFECSQVDPDRTPVRVKLVEPASFERNGDSWEIVDRGRISAV